MREHPDGAGDLADGRSSRARARTRSRLARDLGVPERQLHAERHRLGVHAVRAADHRRPPMFVGARAGSPPRSASMSCRIRSHACAHLQRQRRVEDVGRRQAEVQPARRRPDLLGDRRRERDHVVLRRLLDLFDARDVERRAAARSVARVVGGHDAGVGQRVGGGQLDFEPGLVPSLRRSRWRPSPGACSAESSVQTFKPLGRNRRRRRPARRPSPPDASS